MQNCYTLALFLYIPRSPPSYLEVMQVNAQAPFCVKELACLHWESGCLTQRVPEQGGGGWRRGRWRSRLWDHSIRVEHWAHSYMCTVHLRERHPFQGNIGQASFLGVMAAPGAKEWKGILDAVTSYNHVYLFPEYHELAVWFVLIISNGYWKYMYIVFLFFKPLNFAKDILG